MEHQSDPFTVIVSERAARMLSSHAAFLAQVSETAADDFVTSFQEAAESLNAMPGRCAWFTAEYIPRNTYRYLLFEKRYMILFQIKGKNVYIDYVADCRQDYHWLLR